MSKFQFCLLIIFFIKGLQVNASNEDSARLIKIHYYYTFTPIPNPHQSFEKSQWEIIHSSLKCDSLTNPSTLNHIDSMLRLSKSFRLRLKDSNISAFNEGVVARRVIIFTYEDKKIYMSDLGDWDWNWRSLSKNHSVIKKKKIKYKYVRINSVKTKNDKCINAGIYAIEKYLMCDWCGL